MNGALKIFNISEQTALKQWSTEQEFAWPLRKATLVKHLFKKRFFWIDFKHFMENFARKCKENACLGCWILHHTAFCLLLMLGFSCYTKLGLKFHAFLIIFWIIILFHRICRSVSNLSGLTFYIFLVEFISLVSLSLSKIGTWKSMFCCNN